LKLKHSKHSKGKLNDDLSETDQQELTLETPLKVPNLEEEPSEKLSFGS